MEHMAEALTHALQQMNTQQQQFAQALDSLSQQTQQQSQALLRIQENRSAGATLIDTRGVAKPEPLSTADANDHAKYVVWRMKLLNWIASASPDSFEILESLEKRSNEEITETR
eukprot:1000969-Amphidinium_carterae.1